MEADNEVSGNGNSYTTEFRQYDPRLGRWKSLDPLMHMFPHMSPYCAFDNNPIYFTDPYGLSATTDPPEGLPANAENESVHTAKNGNQYQWLDDGEGSGSWSGYNAEVEVTATAIRRDVSVGDAFEVADNVYVQNPKAGKTDKKLPNDWKLSPLMDELDDVEWQNSDTGFKSALYEKEDDTGRKMYLYAFAGTDDMPDVEADIIQVTHGLTKQMSQASSNTQSVINAIGTKRDLTVTGHSLGGGLANSVALKFGLRSWGFNPAWPSDKALSGLGASRSNDSQINNIVTVGDILNLSQTGVGLLADIAPVGTTYVLGTGSIAVNLLPALSHTTGALRLALRYNKFLK